MANQPKKYKKFVATAATATLVASAIVPVASAAHTDTEGHQFESYINAATELGLFQDGGEFKPGNKLTRKHVVTIVGRYLEEAGKKPAADYETNPAFSDLGTGDAEYLRLASVVKEAGIFSGDNGKINGGQNISRQHMAKVLNGLAEAVTGTSLVEAAKDIEDATVTDLDAAGASYREAIQALADFGITTVETFNPKGDVTRGQFAKFIMETIGAIEDIKEGAKPQPADVTEAIKAVTDAVAALPKVEDVTAATAEADAAKVKAVTDAVAALEKALASAATDLPEEDKAKAEEAIKTATEAATKVAAAIEATKPVSVTAVNATNATTLTVTGEGLSNLKAENITVAGNTVSTVVVAADGKSAVVTLGGILPADQDVKVTIKDSSETAKEFTVKFTLAAQKVVVKDATYDDDTKGQKLSLTIDGVDTTVDYLLSSGYTVQFNAFDKNGATANNAFFGATAANTNGQLNAAGVAIGEYTVVAIVAKGSTVLTSEPAKITVRNLDNNATAISKYEFFKTGTDNLVGGTGTAADTELTSKTLAIGETGFLGTLTLGVGSSATEISGTTTGVVEIKSSNPAVVSVDPATNLLKAEGLGKSNITVTVGKATTTFEVTVSGVARQATTVQASSIKVVAGNPAGANRIKVLDQYGDPFNGATNLEAVLPTSVTGFVTTASPISTDENGFATIGLDASLGALPNQSGTVIIRNATTKATVGSFVVSITANNAVASTKLVYASTSESTDDVLNAELASDDTVTYSLRQFTSENVAVKTFAAGDYTGYTVKFNGNVVAVNGDTTGEYIMVAADANIPLTIRGAGSTTVAVHDATGRLVDQKTVTVKASGTKVSAVAWKATPVINFTTKIDYTTVLDVTEVVSGKDPVVKGLTLASATAYPVRIATGTLPTHTNGTTSALGDIYIDADNDGVYDVNETILSKLTFTATSTSTGITLGTDVVAGFSTAVGTTAKGFINFQITDETAPGAVKPVISTKAVEVNVR